jgi:N-acetylmuramoyl-L-alanine amidase
MLKIFRKLFVLICFCIFSVQVFAAPVVEKIRVGQNGSATRVVLESNQPIKSNFFVLPSPDRFVMDFGTLSFKTSLSGVNIPEKSILKGMRQGLFKPGVIRMVLDLNGPVEPTVFAIPANGEFGFRLVIDLKPRKGKSVSIKRKTPSLATARTIQPKVKPQPKEAPVVVVIDPGHGGVDPGAVANKAYEKHIVLKISKYIKANLSKNKNIKVYLTREKDIFVPLADRVNFAQRKQADIFVSIHADAHDDHRAKGGSIYVLSEKSSDREAARLAKAANKGDIMAGVDFSAEAPAVRNILVDLTRRQTKNKSSLLARSVLDELDGVVRLRRKEVLFAGFKVLKSHVVPSTLVETSYLSNPRDARVLKSTSGQKKIAAAVAEGIEDYIKNHMRK